MRKYLLMCLATICLISVSASAQTNQHKFEVGALFTSLTLTDFKSQTPGSSVGDTSVRGLGGRVSYNLNDYLAIDGEATFFPEAHFSNEEAGQKMQGLIGLKAGVRNRRVGVFAKARPGVMWFGEFSSRGNCNSTSFGRVCGVAHEKDFALDLGGVVEFYPSSRSIIRVDAGNTLIKYQDRNTTPFGTSVATNGALKSNFQLSVGFGWRF